MDMHKAECKALFSGRLGALHAYSFNSCAMRSARALVWDTKLGVRASPLVWQGEATLVPVEQVQCFR